MGVISAKGSIPWKRQKPVRRGGVQHQPNVMDAKQLRKAQQEPEKYKDLIVRLWGVPVHFVDLTKELQDEMIARLS